MATTAKAAPPTFSEMFRASPWVFVDGLVFLSAAVIGGAYLYFYESHREWLWQALGYGWAPVGLWAASLLFVLRYQPRMLAYRWRAWVASGAAVALSLATLSYAFPPRGLLESVSLSGSWGMAVGGPSLLPFGLMKMVGIVAFVPLVLYPRSVGPVYTHGLSHLWRWFHLAAGYAYIGARRASAGAGSAFSGLNQRMIEGRRARAEARAQARGEGVKEQERRPHPAAEPLIHLQPEPLTDTPDTLSEPDEVNFKRGEDLLAFLNAPDVSSEEMDDGGWKLPSLELLAPPEPLGASEEEFQDMAKQVEQALADHGVRVEVTDIKAGPRVVQFGLSPGWIPKRGSEEGGERSRVKVQSILTREKDLALTLMTPYLRVEAPVPGAALVGLEVPVPSPTRVHLRAVIETPEFRKLQGKGGLPIAMGQDTGGEPVVLDLASLPHMLIAGATGSGKSVQINSIIASFLLTKSPEQLRILMVDPKRVELTPYNGIPHLIQPVIVEAEEVTESLRGLNREMIRRYKQMEELGVRNIEVYNERSEDKLPSWCSS